MHLDSSRSCSVCKKYLQCGFPPYVRHDWDSIGAFPNLAPEAVLIRKHYFIEVDFQAKAANCDVFDKA